jgi:hypothetical protein
MRWRQRKRLRELRDSDFMRAAISVAMRYAHARNNYEEGTALRLAWAAAWGIAADGISYITGLPCRLDQNYSVGEIRIQLLGGSDQWRDYIVVPQIYEEQVTRKEEADENNQSR